MKPVFGALAVVALLLVGAVVTTPDEAPRPVSSVACAATRVDGGSVRARWLTGLIVPQYDVIDGRFSLHVGTYRDRGTGLSQKIPWFARVRAPVGRSLRLTATRLGPHRRTFSQVFRRAGGGTGGVRSVYPSMIAPPARGCWRLKFTSGSSRATLTALVR